MHSVPGSVHPSASMTQAQLHGLNRNVLLVGAAVWVEGFVCKFFSNRLVDFILVSTFTGCTQKMILFLRKHGAVILSKMQLKYIN